MTHEISFLNTANEPATKIVWLTDLHLDAADIKQHKKFFDLITAQTPDIIFIGGDISNGANSVMHLKQLAELIKKPFYFILGNHDFYYGSIEKIRALAKEVIRDHETIYYLTHSGVIELTRSCALIGHDSWSDGRAGDFLTSEVKLNDYLYIDELKDIEPKARLQKLNELGDESAAYIKEMLIKAFEKYSRAIVLMHATPFQQTCLYDGRQCDDNWAPHFVCQAAGDALVEVMVANPSKSVLVLSGHTHSGADVQILPNLRVVSGQSDVGTPSIQGIIRVN